MGFIRYHAAEWIRSQTLCYREDPISEKSGSGPLFCLLLGVSSDYAHPITGQVTEVTCPVIGRAQPELTPSKRQKTGPDLRCYTTEDQISYIILQSESHLRCYATERTKSQISCCGVDHISDAMLQRGPNLIHHPTEWITSQMLCYREDQISDIMLRSGSDLRRYATERTQSQRRVDQISDATLQRTKSHTSSCRVDHISGAMLQRGPNRRYSLIARFIGPTWGPSGADRTQVGPMLAPWTLLSGLLCGVEQISDNNLHFILISDLIFAKHKRHPYAILGSWKKFTNDGEQGCYFKWRVQQD